MGYKQEQRRQQVFAQLNGAHSSGALEGIRGILDQEANAEKPLLTELEIQEWQGRADELADEIEKRRAAFESALGRLVSIRDGGFEGDEEVIGELVNEARSNVQEGAAQGKLSAFLREWDAHKAARQASLDHDAQARISGLEQSVETALEVDGNDELKQKELRALRRETDAAARAYTRASAEQRARLTSLATRIDYAVTQMEGRIKQIGAVQHAESLTDYLSALQVFARAFPKDPLSASLSEITRNELLYAQLLELPHSCSPDNPFWHTARQASDDERAKASENWPEIQSELKDLALSKRYTEIWECDTRKGPAFFEGTPESEERDVETARGSSEKKKFLQCQVYFSSERSAVPEFSLQTLTQDDFRGRAKLMTHCNFVKSLISLARFSPTTTCANDIMEKMGVLYAIDDISPLLKLRLMQMLAGYVERLQGLGAPPGWSSMQDDLQSIPMDLHWLAVRHRDVIIANEKAQQILNKYFRGDRFLRGAAFASDLRDTSLQRRLRWVGMVNMTNAAAVVWATDEKPSEVWVVRINAASQPEIQMALEVKDGRLVSHVKLLPAEPLFAPSDDKTTRDHLEHFKEKHSISDAGNLQWPSSWPVNAHE